MDRVVAWAILAEFIIMPLVLLGFGVINYIVLKRMSRIVKGLELAAEHAVGMVQQMGTSVMGNANGIQALVDLKSKHVELTERIENHVREMHARHESNTKKLDDMNAKLDTLLGRHNQRRT
jgi:hypothetical protein